MHNRIKVKPQVLSSRDIEKRVAQLQSDIRDLQYALRQQGDYAWIELMCSGVMVDQSKDDMLLSIRVGVNHAKN